MTAISEDDAKILHQRAITAAAAMIDAEVRHMNGELDEIYYRSFKMYFEMRSRLDVETARSDIEYELSASVEELGSFMRAWDKVAPQALEHAFTIDILRDHLHHGVVPIYAFNKNDYTPIAAVLCLAQGIGLPFVIREPYFVYTFPGQDNYEAPLSDAANLVLSILANYYHGIE